MKQNAYFTCLDDRDTEVTVNLFDSEFGAGCGFECPECGAWGLILDVNCSFSVDEKGNLTLERLIACRERDCGWCAEIQSGVATPLDEAKVSGAGGM